MFDSLCDLLITSFRVHLIIYDEYGEVQKPLKPFTEPAKVEIHTEGLNRKADVFTVNLDHLNPMTKARLEKLWGTKGSRVFPQDLKILNVENFVRPRIFLWEKKY